MNTSRTLTVATSMWHKNLKVCAYCGPYKQRAQRDSANFPGRKRSNSSSRDRTKQQDTLSATGSKDPRFGTNSFLGALWGAVKSYACAPASSSRSIHDRPLNHDLEVEKARARVDWRQETDEEDSEDFSDDEEDGVTPTIADADISASRQLLYTPVGKWNQVANLPIEEPTIVKVLSGSLFILYALYTSNYGHTPSWSHVRSLH